MKVSGQATLRASAPQVYAALNDPAVLVRTLPGCQRLERVGPDTYRATVNAGVAAIRGSFDGDVRLTDQNPPHSFTLHASGVGAPGTVSAVARVSLAEAGDGMTTLHYDADATIGGVLGGVGQRVLTGVARRTAEEFFAAVDRELSGTAVTVVAAPEQVSVAAALQAGPAGVAGAGVAGAGVAGAGVAGAGVAGAGAGQVWIAPPPAVNLAHQRVRDVLVGVVVGAGIVLLGVLVGAVVAGW